MPSVTYMNQSAPFWDFINSLEQQGGGQQSSSMHGNAGSEQPQGPAHPQRMQSAPFNNPLDLGSWGSNFFGGQAFPHRGPPRHHEARDETNGKSEDRNKEKEPEKNDEELRGGNDNGEGPSGNSGSDNEGCAGGSGCHNRCGGGRRQGRCGPGGWGGPHHGGPHRSHHNGPRGGPHGHGHDHGGPRGFGRRGGWDQWGRGGMCSGGDNMFGNGGGFDPASLAAHLFNQFTENETNNNRTKNNPTSTADHTPSADVFDTPTSYVIHISLPGAKKEDVGVNWDAEKSELSVAGVIYRHGDEEFLKTLAVDERMVGPFERKIRLGTRASPANVDADGITAKLEDGVLRVVVGKMEEGFVEIRKVDIE